MIEFIDKTSEQSGTPVNRENLMALQGFIATNITFNDDGSRIETNAKGETLTITMGNGQIVETFEGEKTITKTTNFNSNGSITEVIS